MSTELYVQSEDTAGKLMKLSSVQALDDSSNNRANVPPPEFRLTIYDHSTRLTFLIDSGSSVSVIPNNMIPHDMRQKKSKRCGNNLYAANNTVIKTYGEKVMTINLGLRRDFRWPFIIADVQSAIIGADLIANYGILIDLKNKKLLDPMTKIASHGSLAATTVYNISVVNKEGEYTKLLNNHFFNNKNIKRELAKENNNQVMHYIQTTGPPFSQRPRRVVGEKLKALKEEIEYLLDKNMIRPSNSAWASPVHLQPKTFRSLETLRGFT